MRAASSLGGVVLGALACGGCFTLLTDTDEIAGPPISDAGDALAVDADAATDTRVDSIADAEVGPPVPVFEKRYTEILGRLIGTPTSPLPSGATGLSRGIAFPANGKLTMLFGDAFERWDDPIGFAPKAYPSSGLPPITWAPASLKVPTVDLGVGNVPVDGLVVGDKTYVFVATGWDATTRRYLGSALAHGTDLGTLTLDFAATTSKLVNVSVVVEGTTAYVFGSGAEFRRSPVYLAKTSVDALADRTKWLYFSSGSYVAAEADARPLVDHACVGELSVRKHPRTGLFVMAYQCSVPRGVLVRLAASPEGPWSAPINVMDGTLEAGGVGRTFHANLTSAGHDDGMSDSLARVTEDGGEYGPYLVPDWFDSVATPDKTFGLVYTMSTFNPYTVWLMRTVLGEPGTVASPAPKGVGLPKAAIVNGDFKTGLDGWISTGEVRVYVGGDGVSRVTTSGASTGDTATGTLSQEFTIDATTSRLEFSIHGGDATVKLMRGAEVLRQSWGRRSNDDSSVVWDLQDLRGQKVKIVIEDTLTGAWGFVGATGFKLK